MKKPDFILVGESRCGSTSLYETLIQHQQVILPTSDGSFRYEKGTIDLSQKELRFFDRNWDKGLNWYFNRFKNISQTITGDASATYLYHPEALDRIKSSTPKSKIIILLRNPTDRFISHFYHLSRIDETFKEKHSSIYNFSNIALESNHHILERGIYHHTVSRCLDLFPNSLIVKSEELFSDSKIFNQILNFLEIKPCEFKLKHLRQSNAPKISLPNITKFYQEHNEKLYKLLNKDFNWI